MTVAGASSVDKIESREFCMNHVEFGKFIGEITRRGFNLETRLGQAEPRRSNVLVLTHSSTGEFGHGMVGDYNYGREGVEPSYFFEALKYPVAGTPEAIEAHQQLMESYKVITGRKIIWD